MRFEKAREETAWLEVPARTLKGARLNDRSQFGLAAVIFKRDYHYWIYIISDVFPRT